jgi:hypothetical protein
MAPGLRRSRLLALAAGELVQGHLRAELERAPAGDVRLIGLCAGQGRAETTCAPGWASWTSATSRSLSERGRLTRHESIIVPPFSQDRKRHGRRLRDSLG